MTRKLLDDVALLFVLALSGCGNQSGDIQQGPWYEAGKAESPGEPWPREILKEGAGPVTTPGSLVFITLGYEPSTEESAQMEEDRKKGFRFIQHSSSAVLWLGTPPLIPKIVKHVAHSQLAMIGFGPHLLESPREVKLE